MCHFIPKKTVNDWPHLGNDDRSLSRYSPSAFWILLSKSARRSSWRCTLAMLSTSITSGDFATFFMRPRNSVLTLHSINNTTQVTYCWHNSLLHAKARLPVTYSVNWFKTKVAFNAVISHCHWLSSSQVPMYKVEMFNAITSSLSCICPLAQSICILIWMQHNHTFPRL